MKPTISFIIAAYNEERHLAECIDSCLRQTYPNIEVCVTDDGSTDSTWTILKNYESEKIKINRFSENKGKVSAFNSSFKMSKGEYIAIIGADDVNLPTRIEKQLNHLEDNHLDLNWGLFEHIDEMGKDLIDYKTPLNFNPGKIEIIQDNFIPGNTIFLRRMMASQIFPIPDNLKFEDWWIAFQAIFNFKYAICKCPVIKYRIHSNNTVGNNEGDYVTNRRKNIIRHLAYHDIFTSLLKNYPKYQRLNKFFKNYKLICLEDSFSQRLFIFIKSLPLAIGAPLASLGKFFLVTVLGLKGVGNLFK